MSAAPLPPSPIAALRTIELGPEHQPQLQAFFAANPEYFLAVQGEPAQTNAAHATIHDEPPAGWSFTRKWLLGWVDATGSLVAMADVVTDLLVKGVWHIGLFIVATTRHGNGDARSLIATIERWARANGAEWLRLGVVQGNARAERFWESLGYVQTRTREGIAMGQRNNVVRVMVKPLVGGPLADYLARVERDRPEVAGAG